MYGTAREKNNERLVLFEQNGGYRSAIDFGTDKAGITKDDVADESNSPRAESLNGTI